MKIIHHELGIDFEKGSKLIKINPFDYKKGVIEYIKKTNCPVCFTDKTLSCSDAISAIENETPYGLAICNRVIYDALSAL